MARSSGKKSSKAIAPPTTSSPAKAPPAPFVLPSSVFANSFLSTLATSHVYIVHIDGTPATLKRRVFLVPICMNIVILLALLVRAYYAIPTYGALLLAALGYTSDAKIDTQSVGYGDLFGITVSRTMLFLGDYTLFAFLGSWPWNFVFGSEKTQHSSAVKWRIALSGFQEKEIIVRVSRKWDKSLLPNWTLDDELTLKHKIMPAVARNYVAKTGMLLQDKEWDLDFTAMIKAQQLVASGKLSLSDFEKAVLVHYPPSGGPHGGWMVWLVHREDFSRTVEQRDTLMKFKDKLTAMGLEDVFYRWVELVQYESSMPGGFTEGRQGIAMREAKRLFEERGVDFAKFWEEVGGSAGMPGLDG